MSTTTIDRQTPQKLVDRIVADDALLAASTTIPAGVLVGANAAGALINAADAANCVVLGRAPKRMVNATGGAAKITPKAYVEAGVFKFATSGADALTAADIGRNVFVLDHQTVVKTAGTTNAVVAGQLESIDPDGGVWVRVNC